MNEIITTNEMGNQVTIFASTGAAYCSVQATDTKEKLALFNAVNSPEIALADMVNKQIAIKDIFAEPCQFVDEDGVVTDGIRIVIIDVDGVSYGCASRGVYNALTKLMQLLGEPTWEEGIMVEVNQIRKSKDKNVLTLKAVL